MTDLNRYYTVKGKGKNKKVVRKEIPKEIPTFRAEPPNESPKNKDTILPEPLSNKNFEEFLEQARIASKDHPGLKLLMDEKTRHKIIFGDIERSTEFDKFIVQESNDTNVVEKSQLAYLAKESAYIANFIGRFLEEKIEGEIAEWYKSAPLPFTYRLLPIKAIYEDVEYILCKRLPNLREDFKSSYRKMLAVAKQCDIERTQWFGALPVKPIAEFGLAAKEFYKILCSIHEEALIAMDKLTQTASVGKEETEQKDTAAKCWGIRTWLKKHPHSYGLIGGAIFLILFFILGLFKAQWRNWCWGTAAISFLVLILSLLGGRSSR